MTNETCANCGHDKKSHTYDKKCLGQCKVAFCNCLKFKCKKFKANNHKDCKVNKVNKVNNLNNEICADPECGHLKEEHDIYGFRCHAHQGRCPCKKFIPCKDCMVLHSPENCPQNNNPKEEVNSSNAILPEDTEPLEKSGGSL